MATATDLPGAPRGLPRTILGHISFWLLAFIAATITGLVLIQPVVAVVDMPYLGTATYGTVLALAASTALTLRESAWGPEEGDDTEQHTATLDEIDVGLLMLQLAAAFILGLVYIYTLVLGASLLAAISPVAPIAVALAAPMADYFLLSEFRLSPGALPAFLLFVISVTVGLDDLTADVGLPFNISSTFAQFGDGVV